MYILLLGTIISLYTEKLDLLRILNYAKENKLNTLASMFWNMLAVSIEIDTEELISELPTN